MNPPWSFSSLYPLTNTWLSCASYIYSNIWPLISVSFLLEMPTSLSLSPCHYPHLPFPFRDWTVCDCESSQLLSSLFPLSPLCSTEHLDSYITAATYSSVPDVLFGLSQVSSSSTSDSFFRLVSARRKLQVYTRTINSCRQSWMTSLLFTLQRRFQKSTLFIIRHFVRFYKSKVLHRVVQLSDAPCSISYLLELAYPIRPFLPLPSTFRTSQISRPHFLSAPLSWFPMNS